MATPFDVLGRDHEEPFSVNTPFFPRIEIAKNVCVVFLTLPYNMIIKQKIVFVSKLGFVLEVRNMSKMYYSLVSKDRDYIN